MGQHQLFRLCIFLIGTGTLTAQQLSPSVVSTSGGFYSTASGMLSFTVGEMAAIETYSTPSAIVTQGFQQDWDFTIDIVEHPRYDFVFYFYPNPSDGRFNLITEGDVHVRVEIRIYDILGQEWARTDFDHQGDQHTQPLELLMAPSGTYTMVLITKTNETDPGDHFTQRMQVIR